MTISTSDNTPRISYSVSEGASQSSFAVPFEFFADADLNVYLDGTLKTISTHYSVSGGSGTTGSISMSVTGASGGSTVIITRGIALDRTTDFPTSGSFAIGTLNTELDRFVAIQADLNDTITRSVRLQDEDTAVSMELPLKADRVGAVLGFNASTGAAEAGPKITAVQSLSGITTSVNLLGTAAVVEDMGLLATSAVIEDMGLLATSANVTAMGLLGVSGVITDMGILGTAAIVEDMGILGTSANVTAMGLLGTAAVVEDMGLLSASAVITDMDLLATSANVTAMGVLGTSANVTAMAALSASAVVADMALLGTTDVIADMALLANSDVISDLNTLATSDIVSDLNTLATSDIVSDINTLATSDIVSDLNTLATSDIVTDINLLATSAIVEDLNLLATSDVIADMAALAGSGANPNITSVTASGAITAGSFVIGSADINENDLESIDGITAGTIAASKAAVVDANKDITGFRNITLTGELDAGSLDISGDIDVDGTANLDVVDIDGAVNMATTALVTGVLTTTAATVFNGGFAANDGSTITTADNTAQLTLISTDADANAGPNLRMQRDSASPADNDLLGKITFVGDDDGGNEVDFATINIRAKDVSDGGEDGEFDISTMVAGTSRSRIRLDGTETIFNENSVDVDFRVESNNFTHALFVQGSDGNVGINKSVPVAPLHVVSSDNQSGKIRLGGDGTYYSELFWHYSASILEINTVGAGQIVFSTGNNAEAVRIDSSGDVLISKTSVDTTTDGLVLRERGQVYATSDGNTPVILNRKSSDGDIVQVRKDNTTVGSIGTLGNRMSVGTGDVGLFFNDQTDQIQPINTTTNAPRDNAITLGATDRRFLNLYLSGGVFLGGTGDANKLDDYEEGLHTATLTMGSGTAALSSNRMGYIKTGASVTVFGELVVGSISSPSGGTKLSLPFATAVATAGQTGNREHFAGTAIVSYNTPFSANNAPVLLANEHNVASCQIVYMADDSGFSAYTPATGDTFYISFTYFTSV